MQHTIFCGSELWHDKIIWAIVRAPLIWSIFYKYVNKLRLIHHQKQLEHIYLRFSLKLITLMCHAPWFSTSNKLLIVQIDISNIVIVFTLLRGCMINYAVLSGRYIINVSHTWIMLMLYDHTQIMKNISLTCCIDMHWTKNCFWRHCIQLRDE